MNEYQISALTIATAICGFMICYYWLKGTIESQNKKLNEWQNIAKDKRAIEVKNLGLEHSISKLESELKVEQKKTDLYIQISLDQKTELDKLKHNPKKIVFTDHQNKEILRLRKRGYSFGKIAAQIGFSDETIRKQYHFLTNVN